MIHLLLFLPLMIRRMFCPHRSWLIEANGQGTCRRCGARATITGELLKLAGRVRDVGGVVRRLAVRSEVTVGEALMVGALGAVYVALGLAGGLVLAVYA